MGVRLDKSRKFGTVFGDEIENPKRPRKYWQDKMYFDARGYPIDEPPTTKTAEEPTPAKEPVQVVELKDDTDTELVKELRGKSAMALRKIATAVHEASGVELPAMKGTGVVARLVAYITENTD